MGEIVLTRSELSTLRRVFAALEQKGWSVRQVSVDGARDAFLLLRGAGDSEIIISLKDEGSSIADNFKTVLGSDEFENLAPGEFQYIDLRFGNKVFVNRAEPDSVTATSTESGFIDFEVDLEPNEEGSLSIETATSAEEQ